MKTIQINLPEDIEHQLDMMSENQQDFILEAIKEKIKKKEQLKQQLIEGYQATYEEDLDLANDFELTDLAIDK